MKTAHILFSCLIAILLILAAPALTPPALATASCAGEPISGGWSMTTSNIPSYPTNTSCQFTDTTLDGVVDGCPTNAAVLTVGTNVGISIATGQTIVAGSVNVTASGASLVINPGGSLQLNTPIYATDADGDHYPAYGSHFASTGTVCRTALSDITNYDCGDGNATAHPGQSVAQTGTFTNTQNAALTHDWDCNGTESKTYTTANYSCTACTNGSGYASSVNTTGGYSGSVPACGAAGTYYTITNATCQDPAVGSCSGAYTTASVTQSCL